MTEKKGKNYNENYLSYVRSFEPPTKHFKNCYRAFVVGGLICTVGQFFRYMLEYLFGLSGDALAGAVSIILIFLGALLTGLGVYDRIGRNAGAGSILPITGFANSVTSPAIEFKTEGLVYGMAAKMFIVAGPIIVYGVIAGVLTGILYYVLGALASYEEKHGFVPPSALYFEYRYGLRPERSTGDRGEIRRSALAGRYFRRGYLRKSGV